MRVPAPESPSSIVRAVESPTPTSFVSAVLAGTGPPDPREIQSAQHAGSVLAARVAGDPQQWRPEDDKIHNISPPEKTARQRESASRNTRIAG